MSDTYSIRLQDMETGKEIVLNSGITNYPDARRDFFSLAQCLGQDQRLSLVSTAHLLSGMDVDSYCLTFTYILNPTLKDSSDE